MKKLRVLLSFAAFVFAVAGAVAYDKGYPNEGIFGEHPLGFCVEAEALEEENCGTGGFYQCTVYLEDILGTVRAFTIQDDPYSCAMPFWRWFH